MRVPRVYQAGILTSGSRHVLTEDAAHHVVNVLRMKSGQSLVLFNGDGCEYEAEIIRAGKRHTEVEVGMHRTVENESPLHVTLVQGISRGNRMDLALQKAVELGVQRIVPVQTQYGNMRLDTKLREKRLQHWRGIAIAACEQCGRARLPEVDPPQPLADWLEQEYNGVKLVLHPVAESTFRDIQERPSRLVLLAGPEGGLSDEEVNLAVSHGYLGIRLGPRILRTETAALTALVACQAFWGDLR